MFRSPHRRAHWVLWLVLASCATHTETATENATAEEAGTASDPSDASAMVTMETMEAAPVDEPEDEPAPAEPSDMEAGDSCATCPAYGPVVALGAIPSKLVELSGLAASRRHPGILYAHNDSGDTARFFAIDDKAQITAEMDLTGASATDWEDIAVGPCPSGSCVYLGDIGDNAMTRTEYMIYRVAEPDALATDGSASSVVYERFPFVYPDGKHNAETLLVHPSGRIFVVIKVAGVAAGVYEMPAPLTPGVRVTLKRVTTVSIEPSAGVLTGGSFHPCGDRLLLRTYTALFELINAPGGAV